MSPSNGARRVMGPQFFFDEKLIKFKYIISIKRKISIKKGKKMSQFIFGSLELKLKFTRKSENLFSFPVAWEKV